MLHALDRNKKDPADRDHTPPYCVGRLCADSNADPLPPPVMMGLTRTGSGGVASVPRAEGI
jgi:hypothetical protein